VFSIVIPTVAGMTVVVPLEFYPALKVMITSFSLPSKECTGK
jgi:hypothetical protein